MIRITIGDSQRELDRATPRWVNQQVNRRREDAKRVCVKVVIKESRLDFTLSTPSCQMSGGSRPPRREEREIVDLWDKQGLNGTDFAGGNVVTFLRQLRKKI